MDNVQKAQLAIEGDGVLECWFNPQQYAISKSNSFNETPARGKGAPELYFGGGDGRRLTLELLFDATGSGSRDVRQVTDRLFQMMEATHTEPGGDKKRPPTVTFSWGKTVTFPSVCTNLSVTFTLFRPDGTPIRASATLDLVQAGPIAGGSGGGEPAAQNPTTRADGRVSVRILQDGDSLAEISYAAYGDPTRWREIAHANDIDDPTQLRRGTAITIPGAALS
jgi:nucleoid-associated protein YgaU